MIRFSTIVGLRVSGHDNAQKSDDRKFRAYALPTNRPQNCRKHWNLGDHRFLGVVVTGHSQTNDWSKTDHQQNDSPAVLIHKSACE